MASKFITGTPHGWHYFLLNPGGGPSLRDLLEQYHDRISADGDDDEGVGVQPASPAVDDDGVEDDGVEDDDEEDL